MWALAGLLALSLCAGVVDPAALGVDFGSEFVKVTMVDGGLPNIVTNEIGYRKTPGLVGFAGGELRIGEVAKSSLPRSPLTIIDGLRDILGQPAAASGKFWSRLYTPFNVSEDTERHTVRIRASPDHEYSVEELVGMLLQGIGAYAGPEKKIDGVVFTVPPFWTQRQRQALIDAAGVADLTVLSLVSEPAAAALQYGVDRSPLSGKESSKHLLLYDIGAGSTYAALIRYSKFVGKASRPKGAKGKATAMAIPQLEIVGIEWDADLGGRHFDMRLVEHFADVFNKEAAGLEGDNNKDKDKDDKQPGEGEEGEDGGGGADIREHPRAMVKLQAACKKAKETLSLNKDAMVFVDSMRDGRDFKQEITRVDFEEIVGDLLERAVEPIRRLLAPKRKGGTPPQVDLVEVMGGSIRLPQLQARLGEAVTAALGKEVPLGRQLDAEEAAAMGAGLRASNLTSAGMLGARFGMTDVLVYPVELALKDEGGGQELSSKLLPRLQPLPWKQTVSLRDRPADFWIRARYAPTAGQSALPSGETSEEVVAYKVTGVRQANKKSKGLTDVQLSFSLSRSGLFSLVSAKGLNPKDKKKKLFDLTIEKRHASGAVVPMGSAALSSSARRLRHLQEEAAVRRNAAEAKSLLEGQVLDLRTRVGEEGEEEGVSEEARGVLGEALDQLEQWLSGDDTGTLAAEYKKRARQLRALAEQLLGGGEEEEEVAASAEGGRGGGEYGEDAGTGSCAPGGAAAAEEVSERLDALKMDVEVELMELRQQVEELREAATAAAEAARRFKADLEGLSEKMATCGCRI